MIRFSTKSTAPHSVTDKTRNIVHVPLFNRPSRSSLFSPQPDPSLSQPTPVLSPLFPACDSCTGMVRSAMDGAPKISYFALLCLFLASYWSLLETIAAPYNSPHDNLSPNHPIPVPLAPVLIAPRPPTPRDISHRLCTHLETCHPSSSESLLPPEERAAKIRKIKNKISHLVR